MWHSPSWEYGRLAPFRPGDLDRLTLADAGILVSGSIENGDLKYDYDMDLLGNLTPTAGGFKQNSAP